MLASYHGLPVSYARKGDPYPEHCMATSRLLRERLGWSGRVYAHYVDSEHQRIENLTNGQAQPQRHHDQQQSRHEIGELALPAQAALLRVLETGEVLPLGAAKPRKIELRFCSATHRDLRARVAAGLLREDLYFRIAMPRVVVPPLRHRPEEIPWLLQAEAERTAPGLTLHVSLVEACLLRAWPGNVRELLAEARSAAQAAHAAGGARVEQRHLSVTAGSAFAVSAEPAAARAPAAASVTPASAPPSRARIVSLLKREGSVSAAARALGVHRTQLRRWMERYGLEAPKGAPPEGSDEG